MNKVVIIDDRKERKKLHLSEAVHWKNLFFQANWMSWNQLTI